MRYLFRILDLETGGIEPEHEVIEIGWTDLIFTPETKSIEIDVPDRTFLFKPAGGIPISSMAVHHITPSMVEGLEPCQPKDLQLVATCENAPFELKPSFLVAHKADYEQQWFKPELCGDAKWICTYKAAKHVWPDAPTHSNSGLRYFLGFFDLPHVLCQPSHRAGPDTYVTAHTLGELLKLASVNDMVRWTREPTPMPNCPLGEWRDKPWADVDTGFLRWMLDKAKNVDPDAKHWARVELDRRSGTTRPAAQAQPTLTSDSYE